MVTDCTTHPGSTTRRYWDTDTTLAQIEEYAAQLAHDYACEVQVVVWDDSGTVVEQYTMEG